MTSLIVPARAGDSSVLGNTQTSDVSNHFRAVTGSLIVEAYEPDGDSIRFLPSDISRFDGLRNSHRLRPSKDQTVQLRFEGIDAPELHYGSEAQPLGADARDDLLRLATFSAVKFAGGVGGSKVDSARPKDGVKGFVLTKACDVHGRPISYVYTGTMKFDNPDDVVVTEKLLSASLNWKMLQSGLAYPLIYTSNPVPHRALLRSVAIEARAKASPRTVWARDSSGEFVLRDKASIEPPDGSLIMPKLFRRCVDYLKAVDAGTIHGNLTDWLHANDHTENDRVLFNGIEQPFSSLILQKNAKIALQGDFVDYVFVER